MAHLRIAIGKNGRNIFDLQFKDTSALSDKELIQQHHQKGFIKLLTHLSTEQIGLTPALPIYKLPGLAYAILDHFMRNPTQWDNLNNENKHTAIKLWREHSITYKPKRTKSVIRMYALIAFTIFSALACIVITLSSNNIPVDFLATAEFMACLIYLGICKSYHADQFENPILQKLFRLSSEKEQMHILTLSLLSANTLRIEAYQYYSLITIANDPALTEHIESTETVLQNALQEPNITNQDTLNLLSSIPSMSDLPKTRVLELISDIAKQYGLPDSNIHTADLKNLFRYCHYLNEDFIKTSKQHATQKAARLKAKLRRAIIIHLLLNISALLLIALNYISERNSVASQIALIVLDTSCIVLTFLAVTGITVTHTKHTLSVAREDNSLHNLINIFNNNDIKISEETLAINAKYLDPYDLPDALKALKITLKEMLLSSFCCKQNNTSELAVPLLTAAGNATAPHEAIIDLEQPSGLMAGAYAGGVGP